MDVELAFDKLIEKGGELRHPFDGPFNEFTINVIAAKYGIFPEAISISAFMLNTAVNMARDERDFYQTDLKQQRRKLTAVQSASERLLKELGELDADSFRILDNSAMARGLIKSKEFEDLIGELPQEEKAAIVSESYETGSEDAVLLMTNGREINLTDLKVFLTELSSALDDAQRLAGRGKSGRRSDDSLQTFLGMAYGVFDAFTYRSFTLDWTAENLPLTDAAAYCVEVCRVFEPGRPASQIANSARQARKEFNKFSFLCEWDEMREQLFQQIMWHAARKSG